MGSSVPLFPLYKLQYFDAMGRAEPIRLLFAAAEIPYEDVRISAEQWAVLKSEVPYGQLPVLETDGKLLCQSLAILKFLGFMGKDDFEMAKIDELILVVEDVLANLKPWFNEENETKRIEIFKEIVENKIRPFLEIANRALITNGKRFFVGESISVADLTIFHFLWFLENKLLPGSLRKHSALSAFIQDVGNIPPIKKWLHERPKTDH